jgi:hypothetical protein
MLLFYIPGFNTCLLYMSCYLFLQSNSCNSVRQFFLFLTVLFYFTTNLSTFSYKTSLDNVNFLVWQLDSIALLSFVSVTSYICKFSTSVFLWKGFYRFPQLNYLQLFPLHKLLLVSVTEFLLFLQPVLLIISVTLQAMLTGTIYL